MALERGARPDLVAGTISLTSNSLNFTVSGIDFDAMSVRSGDTIVTRAGFWLVIDQITSATAGTLAFACPAAAAGNNQPLRIRFQPEGSRLMGQAANILARFNSGNVTSIADLVTGANKGVMFVGDGTAGLFDLTAAAREVLNDASYAAMRNTLELSDASIQSRILNSFGNYAPAGGINVNNLNAGDAGLYNTANTGTPTIPGVSWWWIETQRLYSTNAVRQIATAYSSSGAPLPYILVRMRNADGTWGDWSGHSSQWFSNANGFCYRDTSGFQFCYFNATSGADGDFTWTYPAAFTGASPNAWASLAGSTVNGLTSHVVSRGFSSATFRLRFSATNAVVTTTLYMQAVGRWF